MKRLNSSNCANTPPVGLRRASLLLALLLSITFGVGEMWGTTFTTTSSGGFSNNSKTTDGITVTMRNGTSTSTSWKDGHVRVYTGGGVTISSSSAKITKIEFTCTAIKGNEYGPDKQSVASGSSGSYSTTNGSSVGTWTYASGATEIVFNATAQIRFTQIVVTVAVSGPTITKSSSMTTLTYSNGSPVAQSFTIGGSSLTNPVTVTAPTDYEVCKTANGTYASSVTYTASTVNSANQTVYIRLQSGLSAGNISSRNISITSEGATAQTIAVTGSVPYTITWMANGSEHATTYVAVGSTLALPATDPVPNTCGCTGKAFYGWYGGGSSYKNASVAPTIAASGNTVNADKTYYAVFADAEEGDVEFVRYQKVTSAPTNWTTDKYVIATADNGKILTGQASTNNYGDYATMSTTTERASAEITISTTNTANIYKLQQGTKYLALNANGNSLYFVDSYTASDGTNNKCDWKIYGYNSAFIVESPLTYKINNTSGCYRAIQYNATSGQERFACYKHNTQTVAYLYKRVEQQSVNYSNYATSCCSPLGSINGSFFWTTHFCPAWPAKHRS